MIENWVKTTEVLEKYAVRLKALYHNKLEQSGTKATGRLQGSIKTTVHIAGSTYKVELELEEYGKYIEEGRKPGKFPPINAIREWIRVKQIVPVARENNPIPTEKSLAFLIGRSIKEKGIPAKKFLQTSNDEVFSQMKTELTNALIEDITNEITGMFQAILMPSNR